MAPSTPPPPSRVVLAAFTIASTATLVMSPRRSLMRGSAILGFVDEPNAAGVFVKRALFFHRARFAVERKRFHFRMLLAPFGHSSADAALASNIEPCGELAHVMKDEHAPRRQGRVPKIEFLHGRFIFVRAVENDQLGIAAEVFSGCVH